MLLKDSDATKVMLAAGLTTTQTEGRGYGCEALDRGAGRMQLDASAMVARREPHFVLEGNPAVSGGMLLPNTESHQVDTDANTLNIPPSLRAHPG